jgi:hypothetical protein
MISQFLNRGWEVDLFIEHCTTHPLPAFDSPLINIFTFRKTRSDLIELIFRLFFRGRRHYSWIVATPKWSLYWAVRVSRWINVPVICLSDEVYPWNEQHTSDERKWKSREVWAHQRAAFTVSLSEARFQAVKCENSLLDSHPYTIIPNAPSGPPRRLRSSYYRETLGINLDKGILIHSGTLDWTLAKRVAAEATLWSNNWVIVFQGRFRGALDSGRCKSDNVRLSTEVLPATLMKYATSSADIGLALYDRTHSIENRNGETPGKLGLYLSCALPVICGNAESLKWVETEKCGVWVEDTSEIPLAADRIRANYAMYSENAAKVFTERFDYSRASRGFFSMLNKNDFK